MRTRITTILFYGAILAVGPQLSLGATVSVSGIDGTDGISGEPGFDGTAGGNATSAIAIADSADAENYALADGGQGGAGGRGGAPSGAILPGSGGDGGNGGDATARAISEGTGTRILSFSEAEAGFGGVGRRSGNGPGGVNPAASAGLGGDGGNAAASARAINQGSGEAFASATARSGGGGPSEYDSTYDVLRNPGGIGGTATIDEVYAQSLGGGPARSIARAESRGVGTPVVLNNAADGDTTGELWLQQFADAQDAAGTTSSFLSKHTSSLSLTLDSSAFVINGGGSAHAEVSGRNDTGSLTVSSFARGGSGVRETASDGGAANAIATGELFGNGGQLAVSALATAGIGATISNNCPCPETASGAATANATATAHGDAVVNVTAETRSAGSADAPSGVGINAATAFGSNNGTSQVNVLAEAEGTDVFLGPAGKAMATAYGESLSGGDVTVRAIQRSGRGLDATSLMTDQVSGATAGHLTLYQTSYGGQGSNSRGGNAVSELNAENALGGELSITAFAQSGSSSSFSNTGGDASSRAEAAGLGNISATAVARGGSGGGSTGVGFQDSGTLDAVAVATGTIAHAEALTSVRSPLSISPQATANATANGLDSALATANAQGRLASATATANLDDGFENTPPDISAVMHSHVEGGLGNSASVLLARDGLLMDKSGFVQSPNVAELTSLIVEDGAVSADLDINGVTDLLGIGGFQSLAANTASNSTTSLQLNYDFDASQLGTSQDLYFSLFRSSRQSDGFGELSISLTVDGQSVFEEVWVDAIAAEAAFTDRSLMLGSISEFVLAGDTMLEIILSIDVDNPGQSTNGFSFNFLFSNTSADAGLNPIPVPPSIWLFGSVAFLVLRSSRNHPTPARLGPREAG